MELVTVRLHWILRHIYNFQLTSFKRRSDQTLLRGPIQRRVYSTVPREKNGRRHTCRLRGNGLDMPCDSYRGWLSQFSRTLRFLSSFKNRNHWAQFESYLISSVDNGAICIKLDLVEREKSSACIKCAQKDHSRGIM